MGVSQSGSGDAMGIRGLWTGHYNHVISYTPIIVVIDNTSEETCAYMVYLIKGPRAPKSHTSPKPLLHVIPISEVLKNCVLGP